MAADAGTTLASLKPVQLPPLRYVAPVFQVAMWALLPASAHAQTSGICLVIEWDGLTYTVGCDEEGDGGEAEALPAPWADGAPRDAAPPTLRLPGAPQHPRARARRPRVRSELPPPYAAPAPPAFEVPAAPAEPTSTAASPCEDPDVRQVLARANAARASAGLSPVVCDPALVRAALAHSRDMCAQGYFAHVSPEGSTPARRVAAEGARRRSIGENIAAGYTDAEAAHAGWMRSPAHRQNILTRAYHRAGVGRATCDGRALWTELFSD